MVKHPTWGKSVSLNTITSSRNFSGMHPTMKERLEGLLGASGGKVGWGQGLRTDQQQLQLFLSRHEERKNGKVSWNGKKWTRVRGAAAAPPGRSMHGIGLAADLVVAPAGDYRWLADNASKFGLKTFADVNKEPWHVQPVELPNGRRQYEANGSAWGAPGNYRGGSGSSGLSGSSGSSSEGTTVRPMLTPALVARPGDSGPAARVLLEALIARELLDDSAANRKRAYGSDDEQQVRSFQEANGLEIDGIVGPKTWGKLLSSVEPGTQSPMVRVLQTTLIVRHLIRDSEANLDGDYGTLTQARVREFQATSGIDPIATVGPQTWTALLGVKNRVAVSTRDLGVDEDADVDLDDLDLVAIFDEMHAS